MRYTAQETTQKLKLCCIHYLIVLVYSFYFLGNIVAVPVSVRINRSSMLSNSIKHGTGGPCLNRSKVIS